MRFLTRAAGADKIMTFGKKKSSSAVKFDLQSFPIAMGLIILVILAFLLAPITALLIVIFAAHRGIQMLIWASKKIRLKEKSPENLQGAVPAKLIFAGVLLICSCGLAIYCCYLLEMSRFNSNPGKKMDFLDLRRLTA